MMFSKSNKLFIVFVCLVAALYGVSPTYAYTTRPVPTAIQNNFYVAGERVDHKIQTIGTVQTYLLTLYLDLQQSTVGNLSVMFRAFDGLEWYVPTDDVAYAPVVVSQYGIVYSITVNLAVTTSFDDRIHEYTLCYEYITDLVCNAFRVYTDDGLIYSLGYGVDYWISEETSLYTTLYYLDDFFFTSDSTALYCTVYTIDPALCDALIPIGGLGVFTQEQLDLGLPSVGPGTPLNSITNFNGSPNSSFSSSGGWSGWLDDASKTIQSSVDRAFHDGLTWLVGSIVPSIGIDVTPLAILADYLYFFGVYISTVQAVVPIPLFKLLIDLAIWGGNLVWMMMLYGFIRRTTL